MVWMILLCALCTVGLLAAVWLLAAAFLLPVQGDDTYMILLAAGDGERLERQCRAYLLLNSLGAIRRPLYLTDCALTQQGREAAAMLAEDHFQIRLCTAAELEELLHTER